MTEENKDIETETDAPQQDPAQESPAAKADAPAKKAPAKKTTSKAAAGSGDAASDDAEKAAGKKAPAKKPAAKKAPAKKPATKVADAKADDAKADEPNGEDKPAAKKAPAKKAPAKKPASKGETPKQAPAPRPTRARRDKPAEAVTVRAHAKFVRSSARKARLVCDHIRDTPVEKARTILNHSPRAVARDWSKLLESAVANAEHNHALDAEDLHVVAVYADEGPTLKRFQPRAQGRAFRIRKRTSHLTILLGSKE